MGHLSTPLHRVRVPWQGLLLTASLLTFWNPPTTAQLTIESRPFNVAEGKEVLLLAHNLPQNILGFSWYKGERVDNKRLIVAYVMRTQQTTPGPAHSGRETVYSNASLLIQNVTQNDTGSYTIQVIKEDLVNEEATGQFRVYPELPKPYITINNSYPMEDKDAVTLTCEPETQDTTYLWWVNGQSLPVSSRLQLSNGNRILTLLSVLRNDTGPYECETQNPVSANRSDPVTLNVTYGPDTPTISPSDTYYRPGANLNLSCSAASNPPAQYSWLINGTFQQNAQELFIPSITVNNSGSYTCHANNSVTGRNRTTVKTIIVSELSPVAQPQIKASKTTVTEDKDSVNLTCSTNDTGISISWFFKDQSLPSSERMKLSQDNTTLSINPVKREDAGKYSCEVFNLISKNQSDPIVLIVNYNDPAQENGLPAGAIAGIVIGVLALVVLIVAALACFLHFRKTGRASDQRDLTEHKPSVSNHTQDHSNDPPNKMNEVTYSTLNFEAQQPSQPTSASSSPTATEIIYSEVKKK
ncbi:PREDICTED: carcinoembryonic antigen-related cell adhesion molecule 1 isoform X1 [Colobus angolensis palliatus]|uniref:Ig-like domain-containing protein n=1 Tax=Colobus angolensis palliatus TaxID=336983 RepID=A0A2K5JQU3_COLAP|nr:PREDICTED: carcinoembryonic antigen-related cell adhesion molecule 1 isoform X1 [Colobus angolensis palliatus]